MVSKAVFHGILLGLLSLPVVCNAELYVCREYFHELSVLGQYFFRDPSFGRPDGCYQVPDEFVQPSLDLINTQHDLFYIDINSIDGFFGFPFEKDAQGKALIDAARLQDNPPKDEFTAEVKNSPYCNAKTLQQVDALIDSVKVDPNAQVLNDKGILRCLISLIQLKGLAD